MERNIEACIERIMERNIETCIERIHVETIIEPCIERIFAVAVVVVVVVVVGDFALSTSLTSRHLYWQRCAEFVSTLTKSRQ